MFDDEIIIRPPSEADSIIIQITRGCSHNKCTFCGAYKHVPFGLRNDADIDDQIRFAARHCGRLKRVFLGAGDALIVPHEKLVSVFNKVRRELPWIRRISLYANAKAVRSKNEDQLTELKELGLHRVYLGIESGDDVILEEIRKGESARSLAQAGKHIRNAGLFLSTTVLLGISGGGLERSLSHARQTATLLNEIVPNQIAALCVMVLENTELGRLAAQNRFKSLTPAQTATELKELILNLRLDRVQFMANHASNFVPIHGRLQKDKERMLHQIDLALANPSLFVPEHLRAL